MDKIKLGAIGYGSRVSYMVESMLENTPGAEITAITDIDETGVKKRLAESNICYDNIRFYNNEDEMLDNEILDGIFIGTRCSMHTQLAIKVLGRDIPLFLEKPVSTKIPDLKKLQESASTSKSPVVVSFPLRVTPLVQLAKEIIDSGKIGTVENVLAYCQVPYAAVYYHSWYRDENETNGLFLQKATHDFDYINYILGIKPVCICAMKSKQIFKGNKPAGLLCKDCDEFETCPESPKQMPTYGGMMPHDGLCCFAVDTGNEDSGSAIIRYESGMHVTYSQNFFTRNGGAARGARMSGYKGTIEFDWYTDEINVYMHHTPRVENYKIDSANLSHGGGDDVLVSNFAKLIKDKNAISVAPLESGILSALMCLKAKESAETNTFREITL